MIRTEAVTYLVFICRSYNNVSCRQQDQKVHLEHLVLQSSQQWCGTRIPVPWSSLEQWPEKYMVKGVISVNEKKTNIHKKTVE